MKSNNKNNMKTIMKKIMILPLAALILTSCGKDRQKADAFGNFEATEVTVSSETNGKILRMAVDEGSLVEAGTVIAVIDTTMLNLQKAELEAGIRSIRTRLMTTSAQNDILEQQIANLNVNIKRVANMLKDDAATQKQYDDLTGQVEVLKKQIAANNTQKSSIAAEISVYESKRATILEQISRSTVKSPLKGTILEKYSEEGELTAAGKPLVKVSDLSTIKLKVYVDGGQLQRVKIGNECKVRIDDGKNGFLSFTGRISQVSDKAEFTPKIIQTKEERVLLVYQVTILVKNDGSLKSGMPGEAIF
ncbi:MAG: HlyD family efflux transporter periplasmic adaptor subunit [Bacteroidales bacterium]